MVDLLILIIHGAFMIILAMSPFFIGFGILFYSVYFFMNGKHKDLFEILYWKIVRIKNAKKEIRIKQEKLKEKMEIEKKAIQKGEFEIVKINGKHI